MEDFIEEIVNALDEEQSMPLDEVSSVDLSQGDAPATAETTEMDAPEPASADEPDGMPDAPMSADEPQEPLGVDAYLGSPDWTQGEMPEPPRPQSVGMSEMPEWSAPSDTGMEPMGLPQSRGSVGSEEGPQPQIQMVVPEGLSDELASAVASQMSEMRTQIVGEFQDMLTEKMQMLDRRSAI